MALRKSRSASLQKQSHNIDVKHLQLHNTDSALHEFKANPQSNVSKSADFVDIVKQWTRINGKNFDLEQMRAESEINNNCKVFRTCNCIKRLIFIMNFYDQWCRKNEKKKVCKGLSINDIIEGLPNFNLIQLWNDFIHAKKCHFIQTQNNQNIVETIQVWEYIESKLGVRDLDKCAKFARNNRNRDLSGTLPQRQALYFGFTQSEEIITIQFCDIIWQFFFHSKILFKNEFANKILYNPRHIEQKISPELSTQNHAALPPPPQRKSSRAQKRQNSITGTIGKRIQQRLEKQREKEFQNRDINPRKTSVPDTFVYNQEDKKQFEQYIAVKNKILNTIHGENINNDVADSFIKSKFVTNVYSHNNIYNKKSTLSFGVSFVYWEGYNSWHTYIKTATFANLKEEMLKNPYYRISLFQWTDTLLKAMKLNASHIGCAWVAKNAGILNKRYSIRAGLPISIAHIMSILFYINFKNLQYAFKTNGCRRLQQGESTNNVKKRNKNIGHWYKLFTECITLYGEITCKDMIFYHGLNKQILFDAFKPNFNCMISTTSSLSVAQSIISNNAGIIIKLQQKRSLPYGFLDVHWMTDFQNESEKIFSFSKLDIVDIYQNQPTFESNTVYVKSLILFQSIMKGHYFQHTLHPDFRYQKVIICMIENWMEEDEEKNERDIEIPSYMQLLFNSFVNKQQQLYIIRSQYNHLYDGLKRYLIDFDQDNNYEFGGFLSAIKNKNNGRLKLILMNEFRWEIAGDTMDKFQNLAINSTIKGKYFHAGNDVVLYPRLRRSDRDFPKQSMMFCYVEDMPSHYNRISLQWELFCKQTNYHSSIQTRFLKKNEFAGYTVSNTKDLCQLDSFTFQIAVQILDIDKKVY